MEYNVDKKNFRIEIKGSVDEIKKFARCLVEIVNKSLTPEFEYLVNNDYYQPINVTATQRISLDDNCLLYVPNVGSKFRMKIEFDYMLVKYEKAKEMYLNKNKDFLSDSQPQGNL